MHDGSPTVNNIASHQECYHPMKTGHLDPPNDYDCVCSKHDPKFPNSLDVRQIRQEIETQHGTQRSPVNSP
jgi:hypothetical protein